MFDNWLELPAPVTWAHDARLIFFEYVDTLAEHNGDATAIPAAPTDRVRESDQGLAAALQVIRDLASQGWQVRPSPESGAQVRSPDSERDPMKEKARVRRQELVRRDEQLRTPSVRRFVADMERPREREGRFVSIFNLMRDGEELAAKLRALAGLAPGSPAWRKVIDPYVEVVTDGARCDQTGLRLVDIWRYFRHTWTNPYTNTPGRTMMILVRDRAADHHPVIGIAALGSSIVQISERDRWIGWRTDEFLAELDKFPSLRVARWLDRRLDQGLTEIYLDDLTQDGLFWPGLWDEPNEEAIRLLRNEARLRRRDHHRFVRRQDFKRVTDDSQWLARAESDLYRSKRCVALAGLLRARLALAPYLRPRPSRAGLKQALVDRSARRAIADVLRKARGEAVGTLVADLTVCGAVAPYNAILGGKLVSMLAVSPTVVRAYGERYRDSASEIASSLAGRAICRRSDLVFIGTTSLYGSGSSQYNRIRIPGHVLRSQSGIAFERLGRSRSFGTSHLSGTSVRELVLLAEQRQNGARINSIFGEGVNPKLRKVRTGLSLLGWPSNELLQHGRERLVYGVSLVDNLLDYLVGLDAEPRYRFPRRLRGDVSAIADWWISRWLAARSGSDDVLLTVASHSRQRPVTHGARVQLPAIGEDDNEQSDLVEHEGLGGHSH
jgi:hypothetical protein